jgi:hypothetical protein
MFLLLKQSPSLTAKGLYQNMQASIEFALNNRKINFNPIQVNTQVPQWLNDNHPIFVNFLQYYYDWLVDSYGNTGTNLMDMSQLFDVDEAPEFLLPNYIRTYAPDLIGIYDIGITYQPTPEQIRRTITNIKTELYQRKSNEDAFRTLMPSLFGISADTVKISYPKRKLMRLNAGRLDWMTNSDYYGITGEYSPERYTMVGSHLNQGVFPDSGMWQEFSYLLTSEVDDSNPYYEAVVKETLHPAGLLGLYEKIEKYSEGGYESPIPIDYEVPLIANYYPYTLGSQISLSKCSGCTGALSAAEWLYPTYVYPSWDVEIAGGQSADFGSIILQDFFVLNSFPGKLSPNDQIGNACNFACGVSGEINFEWYVGVGLTSDIAYVEFIEPGPISEKEPTDLIELPEEG